MTKEELIDIIGKILKTCSNLDFLSKLELDELEKLIACIRDRLEKEKTSSPP